MLTDTMVEEDFELKEEELWLDQQDLERGTAAFVSAARMKKI